MTECPGIDLLSHTALPQRTPESQQSIGHGTQVIMWETWLQLLWCAVMLSYGDILQSMTSFWEKCNVKVIYFLVCLKCIILDASIM